MNSRTLDAAQAETLITTFLSLWYGRNVDVIMSYLADNAVYHNVPVAPIVGATAIRGIFIAFLRIFRNAAADWCAGCDRHRSTRHSLATMSHASKTNPAVLRTDDS